MRRGIVLLLTAILCVSAGAQTKDVRTVMKEFLTAFSKRDLPEFIAYFAEAATVFFPPAASGPSARIQGRGAIEQTFKTIFANNKQSPSATRPPIAPQDLLIQELDS